MTTRPECPYCPKLVMTDIPATPASKQLADYKQMAESLKDIAESFGVPLENIFFDADDYPDFDDDASANYHIGYFQGVAMATQKEAFQVFQTALES